MNTLSAVRRLTLIAAIFGFILVACRCSFTIASECALNVRDMVFSANENSFTDCGEYVSAVCPDADPTVPGAVEAEVACISQAADAWMYGGQNQPVPDYPTKPAPDGAANSGLQDFGGQSFAPPEVVIEEPVNCAPFAITAPGDGLANGTNMLGWTLPTGGTFGYRIHLLDEQGNVLRSFNLLYSTTSYETDMSQAAIGGAFQITVQIQAIRGSDVVCTTSRTYLREATDPGVPPAEPTPVIEPTPEPPR